ncbi:MAG: PorV/PorQ family protein [Gemmatimonadetes bacterium]|nr:PorV/PorQ family protein [Gemmatimonadota bacterium]
MTRTGLTAEPAIRGAWGRLVWLILMPLFTSAAPGFAQEESPAGLAALELPIGARPLGMGRAYVASSGDLQGLFYNPAGLAARDSIGLTFSRYQGASDLDVTGNFGAASLPLLGGAVTVAASFEDFGSTQLTGSTPEPLGTLDLRNLVLVASYAYELSPSVSVGASAKYLNSDLGVAEGSGVSFDAGALLRPAGSPLTIGAAVLNVGPKVTFKLNDADEGDTEGAGDDLPSRFRWGAALDVGQLTRSQGEYGLRIAADVEHNLRELGEISAFGGAAVEYRDMIVLRGGVLNLNNPFGGESATGASLGAGVHWQKLRVDVARELGVNEAGDETHFSFGVEF